MDFRLRDILDKCDPRFGDRAVRMGVVGEADMWLFDNHESWPQFGTAEVLSHPVMSGDHPGVLVLGCDGWLPTMMYCHAPFASVNFRIRLENFLYLAGVNPARHDWSEHGF